MAQRKTLTEKQVDVLRWISDGCPDGVWTDNFHRITAAALRTRGFVKTTGRGPTWAATITSAGREYLAQVDSNDPPAPRQPNGSITQQLVDDVIAAGGVLRVPQLPWAHPERVDYRRRVEIAQRLGKVPDGKRLEIAYGQAELVIRLVDGPSLAQVEMTPVGMPDQIRRHHRTAREYRDRRDRHEVSREQLARTVKIVHVIATEADRRGWETSVPDQATKRYGNDGWTATKYGHVEITAGGELFWLRIQEESVHARGPWEAEVDHYRNVSDDSPFWGDRKIPRGPYDADANGRVNLTLHSARGWSLSGRRSRFGDRQSWTLESRLPHLFKEIEERVIELRAQDAAQKIKAGREAEAARIAAEDRERQWHVLMAQAHERLIEEHRAAHSCREADAWRLATSLEEYCDAIEASYPDGSASANWTRWIRGHAKHINPLTQEPALPDPPEATIEALQKHLPAGWSAEGPEHRPHSFGRPRW